MKKLTALFLVLSMCAVVIFSFGGCKLTPKVISQPTADKVSPTEKDSDTIGGSEFGEDFVPDIIDDDVDVPLGDDTFDDSVKYDYSGLTFDAPNYTLSNGVFTSSGAGVALAEAQFPYGTLTMTVRSLNTVDTGFVFGYTRTGYNAWEGEGIEYYFLFLGQGGVAYLGKTQNGVWSALKTVNLPSAVDANKDYDLKLIYRSNKIVFYVDGVLQFGYKDENPLKGTGFGFRTGVSGVTIKNFVATSEYIYG